GGSLRTTSAGFGFSRGTSRAGRTGRLMRSLSCSRRSTIALPISFVFVWVVVCDNSLSAWLASAAPENAPSWPLVHDPFDRKTGDVPEFPEIVAGQNIVCVCARTSAGYPIANKPVMPKDTARLENLGMACCMPAPLLKRAMIIRFLHNIWLHNCNSF